MLPNSPVYNGLLWAYRRTSGATRLFFRCALESLIRTFTVLGDGGIRTEIRGKILSMPISHRLPLVVANCPIYDELLTRLSHFLRNRYSMFCMVDVGANIGDTILACANDPADRFLAVEVNQRFLKYLRQNCAKIPNLTVVEALCADENAEVKITVAQRNGTASVRHETVGRPARKMTLDSIVESAGLGQPVRLIKIDTDGYDFQVLRGAGLTIGRDQPAVLFESDVFGNTRYVQDLLQQLANFAASGYERAVVYDSLGFLFDVVDLRAPERLTYALLYQLNRRVGYFDVLVMKEPDLESFLQTERSYFASIVPDAALRPTAEAATRIEPCA